MPQIRGRSRETDVFISGKILIERPASPILVLDHAPHGLCARLVEPIGIEPMTSSLQS